MKLQIARGVRVHITQEEYEFFQSMQGRMPGRLSSLPIEQQPIAQRLGDKTVFVRKKLEITTQYNLNKNLRFIK